jgi:Zn-finger nucleic acid-binding protein
MKCPVCNVELKIADRQGVEIDYCPQCRGVWLDRGEIDKIIERSTTFRSDPSVSSRAQSDDEGYVGHPAHDRRYRKKKSFLGEMFDFD